MAFGLYFTTISSTDIDELGIYWTHASLLQYFRTKWLDRIATECLDLVSFEHSALSKTYRRLEDFMLTNLDRSSEILIKSLLSQEFDTACLREREDGILYLSL